MKVKPHYCYVSEVEKEKLIDSKKVTSRLVRKKVLRLGKLSSYMTFNGTASLDF